MGFPRRLLNEGEEVIADLRPHWLTLVTPIVGTILALVLTGVVFRAFGGFPWPRLAPLVILGLDLLWLAARWVRWTTTNFVVTSDRLIYRAGVVAKKGREIPLERVNDIAAAQTVFERMIGAGDLIIESGGERGQQVFSDIRRPFELQNTIYKAMEDAGARDAARIGGGRPLSVPEQIEKLHGLRESGAITAEEYEAQKAKLLERM